jgi:hypothetical protein
MSTAKKGSIAGYGMLGLSLVLALIGGRRSAQDQDHTPHAPVGFATPDGDADADDVGAHTMSANDEPVPTPKPSPTTPRAVHHAAPKKAPSVGRQLVDTLPGGTHVPNNMIPFMGYMARISAPGHRPTVHHGHRSVTISTNTRQGVHVRASVGLAADGQAKGQVRVTAQAHGQRGVLVAVTIATPETATAVSVAAVDSAIQQAQAAPPVTPDPPAPTPPVEPVSTPEIPPMQPDVIAAAPADSAPYTVPSDDPTNDPADDGGSDETSP